jgi:Zn-dependent protease
MRDPFTWSVPVGRLFGITIRVHLLFPLLVLGFVLRVAYQEKPFAFEAGTWLDVLMLSGLLFVAVLCHEYGHCFAARWVGGDAHEVLIWPLGGLASVDVPHHWRAHFLTAAAGPAVNVLLCLICAGLLAFACDPGYQPPWNLNWYPFRWDAAGNVKLTPWGGTETLTSSLTAITLARFFYLNWWLFLFNIVLVGYPMDSGRMLQSALWPSFGYRQATLIAIYFGFLVMLIVGVVSICFNEILLLCLALFIYLSCRNQLIILETGGEEGLFGYDFSQGYTSLERDQPPPRPRVSWWKRWLQRRNARKIQRQQETYLAEERRFDALLEKVHQQGLTALTDEERRFMKRVSDRYRNRK